jgi:translation initiation factor 2 alpha subunit (eIF-2alpha)
MHPEYTTIAKLIPRGAKMVNAVMTCDRTKRSRDASTQRALPDQDRKEVLMWSEEAATAKLSHPLARSTL